MALITEEAVAYAPSTVLSLAAVLPKYFISTAFDQARALAGDGIHEITHRAMMRRPAGNGSGRNVRAALVDGRGELRRW